MTSRERFLIAMAREIPDRVPRAITGLTPKAEETFRKNAGSVNPADFFNSDVRGIGYAPSKKNPDYKKYFEGRGLNMERLTMDEFGVGHIKSEHTDLHYTHFISPLKDSNNLNDFINYPLPDFDEPYRSAHWAEETAALHKKGFAVSASMEMTLFEKAWQIRGFEEFLIDMRENPDIINCLLDRILAMRIRGAEL